MHVANLMFFIKRYIDPDSHKDDNKLTAARITWKKSRFPICFSTLVNQVLPGSGFYY
jgi:hypothetical protein